MFIYLHNTSNSTNKPWNEQGRIMNINTSKISFKVPIYSFAILDRINDNFWLGNIFHSKTNCVGYNYYYMIQFVICFIARHTSFHTIFAKLCITTDLQNRLLKTAFLPLFLRVCVVESTTDCVWNMYIEWRKQFYHSVSRNVTLNEGQENIFPQRNRNILLMLHRI